MGGSETSGHTASAAVAARTSTKDSRAAPNSHARRQKTHPDRDECVEREQPERAAEGVLGVQHHHLQAMEGGVVATSIVPVWLWQPRK